MSSGCHEPSSVSPRNRLPRKQRLRRNTGMELPSRLRRTPVVSSATTAVLRFPPEVSERQVMAALLALAGGSRADRQAPTRLTITGANNTVLHSWRLSTTSHVPAQQLRAAVPGLTLGDPSPAVSTPLRFTWRLWLSSGRRPLTTDRTELISRAVLVALAQPKAEDEVVQLDWLLGPVRRPRAVGTRHAPLLSESWGLALATAAFQAPGELDADGRRALRSKYAFPGWRAIGLISVSAKDRVRAQQLATPVLAALRTAEGASSHFGIRRSSPRLLHRTPWHFNLLLSVPELVGLLGWPIGSAGSDLPVDQRRARLLPPPHPAASVGRVLGQALIGGQPVRLTTRDASQHTYVIGPTGTGKSVFLVRQILADIEAGHSVVALDAQGQLINEILARYPNKRREDLVVVDAAEPAPVGVNPFASRQDPALIADQMLGIFARLYADSWGPRTADVLGNALATAARSPGTSLATLPLLLTNPAYRRRVVGQIDDPLGLTPFWQWYDSLSEDLRLQIIAPTLNKVRPFLVRPNLRAVLGQVTPRFDLLDIFTQRRVVLLDLAKGTLGPEGSSLLGTTFLNMLWQTTQTRSAVPVERRHPVGLYIDEAQDFLKLPGDIAQLLAQARKYNLAVTLAHQNLAQLSHDLQEALLSNARSRVVFQLASRDARVLAQGHPELSPDDIINLPAYETYMSLVSANTVTPYASVRTLALAKPTQDPAALRRAASARYGRPRAETEAHLRSLVEGSADAAGPVGQRRRRPS